MAKKAAKKEAKKEVKVEPVEKEMTKIHNGVGWVHVYACCKANPCEC
tara:strand:- start:2966 stop:3106 length:141 start_codon:yes stop_codon:yes gene_type:complete